MRRLQKDLDKQATAFLKMIEESNHYNGKKFGFSDIHFTYRIHVF